MTQTAGKLPEMIDMVFDLAGESPHASYPFDLWDELLRLSPLLATQAQVGILPLRLTGNSDGMLLPKRTKLAIRLPEGIADRVAEQISEQPIKIGHSRLLLGKGKRRPIQHSPTVHAQIVAGASDEVQFIADISAQLRALGIVGNLICGKRQTLGSGQKHIEGFSLVIHDLKADASLKLQYAGLGGFREFGCGIFIPYKVITGLDDD